MMLLLTRRNRYEESPVFDQSMNRRMGPQSGSIWHSPLLYSTRFFSLNQNMAPMAPADAFQHTIEYFALLLTCLVNLVIF
jgi:hypothetical protein